MERKIICNIMNGYYEPDDRFLYWELGSFFVCGIVQLCYDYSNPFRRYYDKTNRRMHP